eukprot:05404.XXX_42845_42949_1 [CDS] Oithona nana genome sequencing.
MFDKKVHLTFPKKMSNCIDKLLLSSDDVAISRNF